MKATFRDVMIHSVPMILYKGTKSEVRGIVFKFDSNYTDIDLATVPSSFKYLWLSKDGHDHPNAINTSRENIDLFGIFLYRSAINPEIKMSHHTGDNHWKSLIGRYKYKIEPSYIHTKINSDYNYDYKKYAPHNNEDGCLIVSGFAGIGKSYFAEKYKDKYDILDLDSSSYSWITKDDGTKEKNPCFALDYLEAINDMRKCVDFLFVSTHEDIRREMKRHAIPFITVCPKREAKDQWIKRLKKRNPDDRIIPIMEENWDKFLDGLDLDSKYTGQMLITLDGDKYLDISWLEDCKKILSGKPYTVTINGQEVTLGYKCCY